MLYLLNQLLDYTVYFKDHSFEAQELGIGRLEDLHQAHQNWTVSSIGVSTRLSFTHSYKTIPISYIEKIDCPSRRIFLSARMEEITEPEKHAPSGLRSWHHYPIQTKNGWAGTVKDIILDNHQWNIRYLVVNLSKVPLLIHQLRLVPIDLVELSDQESFYLNLSQEQLTNSPQFKTNQNFGSDFESDIYSYYHLAPYWNIQEKHLSLLCG